MTEYTIYMYIYDEYQRFKAHFTSVNDFLYKNRITSLIQYYKQHIDPLGQNHKIHYEYYTKYELNAIEIIQDKITQPYIPPYRLLLYNDIHEASFGIHRYGWKHVIANFVLQNYWEKDEFYFENPEFEWVAYALEVGVDDYSSAKTHFLANREYKDKMEFKRMKFIIFDEWLEKKYLWKSLEPKKKYHYPFLSFIHDPPLCHLPEDLYNEFQSHDTIQLLEKNADFLEEKENLKILITLSDFHKQFIERNELVDTSTIIKNLHHPLEVSSKKCSFDIQAFIENDNKSLFMIGWWLRKYDIFLKLSCKKSIIIKKKEGKHILKYIKNEIHKTIEFPKSSTLLYNSDLISDINIIANTDTNIKKLEPDFTENEKYILTTKWNTIICDFLEDAQYDEIFSKNIIFLDIYSCSANNIILECIMHSTPILVCNYPTIIEYLGIDYPLYFTNSEDAERKSQDLGLIMKTHHYLKQMDKSRFTYLYFNHALHNIIVTNIYQEI